MLTRVKFYAENQHSNKVLPFGARGSDNYASLCIQGDHSPDTTKFPDNSLTIRGTPDHFHWYSYHACTASVKVNDQTVKFIFNDNDFIMITS